MRLAALTVHCQKFAELIDVAAVQRPNPPGQVVVARETLAAANTSNSYAASSNPASADTYKPTNQAENLLSA